MGRYFREFNDLLRKLFDINRLINGLVVWKRSNQLTIITRFSFIWFSSSFLRFFFLLVLYRFTVLETAKLQKLRIRENDLAAEAEQKEMAFQFVSLSFPLFSLSSLSLPSLSLSLSLLSFLSLSLLSFLSLSLLSFLFLLGFVFTLCVYVCERERERDEKKNKKKGTFVGKRDGRHFVIFRRERSTHQRSRWKNIFNQIFLHIILSRVLLKLFRVDQSEWKKKNYNPNWGPFN